MHRAPGDSFELVATPTDDTNRTHAVQVLPGSKQDHHTRLRDLLLALRNQVVLTRVADCDNNEICKRTITKTCQWGQLDRDIGLALQGEYHLVVLLEVQDCGLVQPLKTLSNLEGFVGTTVPRHPRRCSKTAAQSVELVLPELRVHVLATM